MTDKEKLDKTVDLWYEKWKKGENPFFHSNECPLCKSRCHNCILDEVVGSGGYNTCMDIPRKLGIYNDTEEVLRHLLQLRLYLYGNVKRWTR